MQSLGRKNPSEVSRKRDLKTSGDKQSRTLMQKAYRLIKQMIFDQKAMPRQRLVYEELSAEFGMSRTPIINALIRLEEEGFLVSEAYRGFRVKPISSDEAWDLFGTREALEAYAVEEAIKRADKDDLEQLKVKMETHSSYDRRAYTRAKFILDAEFHIQIAAITRNRVLETNLKTNMEHIYLRFPVNNMNPERMVSAVAEHSALFRAMLNKNICGGVQIIRDHIRHARDTLMSCLSNDESETLFDIVFPEK